MRKSPRWKSKRRRSPDDVDDDKEDDDDDEEEGEEEEESPLEVEAQEEVVETKSKILGGFLSKARGQTGKLLKAGKDADGNAVAVRIAVGIVCAGFCVIKLARRKRNSKNL